MNLLKIILFILVLMFVFMIVYIISYFTRTILGVIRKKKFKERYGIGELPKSIKVKSERTDNINSYVLRYPYWARSKKDGTADLRIKRNYVIWQNCYLYVNGQIVETNRPYDMLYIVRQLRQRNVKIGLCIEEKNKYLKLFKIKQASLNSTNIKDIINHYAEKPTDFEHLCAKLFERMGFVSEVTAQTNDGGYDIILKKGSVVSIVECKCYSTTHKVGRPDIQKLVGANSVVLADKMIFITTSDFSSSAISYATKSDVILVNGKNLMKLLRKYNFFKEEKAKVSLSECQLENIDLRPFIAIDIYERYFC